ncbi:MAG: hypothetical protein ACJ8FO_01100 [Sphingomicrobium sp.]
MIGRTIIAGIAAALIAVQVVRNAAVAALADTRPTAAAQFWSGHPATEISTAMTQIGQAARERRPVPASVFAEMADAACKEPLAPEPFLVRGVQAELGGDGATAQRAFEAAQWRDPRSLPAAYFLADRYFRVGDAAHGLQQIAALARLAPEGTTTLAPYLAAYARDPVNWPMLRRLFAANPALGDSALTVLASKPETASSVLALADARHATQAGWLLTLLQTLTGAGQYSQARAIWAKASGISAGDGGELLHDASFTDRTSPPPFNWALAASTVGLAERQPGQRLHILYYGQEDGFLASQLLLLPSGAYRLSMQLLGDRQRARALSWSVWCDKASEPIASATLEVAAARGFSFQIPASCPAQWLRLAGASSDMPQQNDVTIASLKLGSVQGG